MKRAMICTVVLALGLGSARAGEPVALPKGPPPVHVLVSMKDGKLQVKQVVFVTEFRNEERTRTVLQNGKQVEVKEVVKVLVYRPVMQEFPTGGGRVFGTDGKEIEGRRLAELLKKERVALLSSNQQMVEPFYLQTVREGTLIVVLPLRGGAVVDIPVPPPPPPPPPPKK